MRKFNEEIKQLKKNEKTFQENRKVKNKWQIERI